MIKERLSDRLHLVKAYQSIFNTPDGEIVIRHLMRECGLLKPKITTDTNILLIRQGEQRIVLSMLRIIGKDQHSITKMIQESMEKEDE